MAKKTVLAIGIEPSFVDFDAFPGLTPELVRSYIEAQIERLRALGFEAEGCLIDLGGTAEAVVRLVETLGGNVIGLSFVIELEFLKGRHKLAGRDVFSILKYQS